MKIYRQELEKIKGYKPGKPIEEVKRELGLAQVYKLASNEIPFSPFYIDKAILDDLKNINRYPEGGCFYLRERIAKKLKVAKNQIIFGNGSDELIVLTLRALIEKGDEVIVSYPTFLIYEIQARINNAKVIKVPLKNLGYCLDEIAKKVTKKTKIIFIANPDNPTGTYLPHRDVESFLKKIPDRVLVYFDEAYFEFAPKDFPRTLQFLKGRKNVMLTRTFSKAYGLAGLRIGYGVASRELAEILNKVREPFNVNRFAQVAAIAALKDKYFLKKVVSYIKREKLYLYKELKKCGLCFRQSATNFILIDYGKDTTGLYNYLLSKGIVVRTLKSWGLDNFFRVTVGKHKENKKFISCLRQCFSQK
ncbi:MAG: histidinol-phosphate transaminase [Omnitrophica bacterium]|nr:histidinol-phosphate transaminase [Candidatus Omnitrophota bacterium]